MSLVETAETTETKKSEKSISFDGIYFYVKFPYKPWLVEAMRTVPGAAWRKEERYWKVEATRTAAASLLRIARKHRFELTAEAKEEIEKPIPAEVREEYIADPEIAEMMPRIEREAAGPYVMRRYQAEAVDRGLEYFRDPRKTEPVIEVLPTGSGKSLVIANIAKELTEPTIVFQPSKEILEQNYGKLKAYGVTDCSIFSASFKKKDISKLTYATIGSVVHKKDIFREFKYMIMDECHYCNSKKGMYKEFFEAVGEKILGLTATPYRLSKDEFGGSILKFLTRTRPRVFKEVIYQVQIGDLFKAGYLAKLSYELHPNFDSRRLTVNSTGADYIDESVKRYYEEIGFKERVYSTAKSQMEKRKNVLVFTRFVDEAEALSERLGASAAIVSAETPAKERDRIIKGFKAGEIKVVANVGVLSIGFDYPELETVILARPTRSLALYYQMIGRGIRPSGGKSETVIVDMCDNFQRFGKVEDLKLVEPKSNLWHIESNGRQLTNVYFQ